MDAAAHAAVLPDGNGGAVCKNTSTEPGSCTLLSVDCAGTYTEYVDPQGVTFGKCTKVFSQGGPKFKANGQKQSDGKSLDKPTFGEKF